MTVERKITSRHEVDSRPLSEWLRALGGAQGGAARLSARTRQAALLAFGSRFSRGYPAGRAALRAVIEIIALQADSTAIPLVPRARCKAEEMACIPPQSELRVQP